MSFPFSISAVLQLPLVPGQTPVSLPFSDSDTGAASEISVLSLSGSGTKSVDLGTVSDYKLLIISQDADSEGDAVTIKFDGASVGNIQISPGGFIIIANPTAQTAPTISIVHTADAVVRLWALG